MSPIRKVDHVAVAVPSIADAIPLFGDALGGELRGDAPQAAGAQTLNGCLTTTRGS